MMEYVSSQLKKLTKLIHVFQSEASLLRLLTGIPPTNGMATTARPTYSQRNSKS